MNKHTIVGRLGADPASRATQTGTIVVSLVVATDHRVKRGDTWEKATEWHRVAVFGRTAETCAEFLRKGSLVYIEGRVSTRKWQDKDGNDRYSTETIADTVQFLDRAPASSARGRASSTPGLDPRSNYDDTTIADDDIPF